MISRIEGSKMSPEMVAPTKPNAPAEVARLLLGKCETANDALRLGEKLRQSYAWREEVELYKLAINKFPEQAETFKSRWQHPVMQRKRATFAEMERAGMLRRVSSDELLAISVEA